MLCVLFARGVDFYYFKMHSASKMAVTYEQPMSFMTIKSQFSIKHHDRILIII